MIHFIDKLTFEFDVLLFLFLLFLKVRELTLKFILNTNSSFRLVENEHFLELISYVSSDQAKAPTTKILMSALKGTYAEAKNQLIAVIGQAKYVCLTADLWTKNTRSYIGITAHLFDSHLKRTSYLLAFRRMRGRHTHVAIREMLLSIIREFQIKRTKITHIITDGAKNFMKAFEKKAHNNEPNTNTNATEDDACISNDEEDFEIDIDELLETVGEDEIPDNIEFETLHFGYVDNDDDDEDSEALPKQLRCVSHSLNLIGTDFDKRLTLVSKRSHDILEGAYSKLKKFLNLCHRSCISREIVENVCKRSFPQPSTTRWNSKFDTINLAEKYKQQINKAIEQINAEASKNAPKFKNTDRLEKLTSNEWKILKDYCTCMHHVAAGLDILQGETVACQGYILPVLHEIIAGLSEAAEKGFASDYGEYLHEALNDCLDCRFKHMMQFGDENKDLIIAAAIHPSFKLSWIHNESDREYVQTMLINACVEFSSSVNGITSTNGCDLVQADDQSSTNAAASSFFRHLRGRERRSSGDDSITLDIYKYILQPPVEPSPEVFRGSALLEDMFLCWNTTLCSSAPVERLFSKALIIFTPRRNRLSDEHFEKALFVQYNHQLLVR